MGKQHDMLGNVIRKRKGILEFSCTQMYMLAFLTWPRARPE
jgi:hypothetical protein